MLLLLEAFSHSATPVLKCQRNKLNSQNARESLKYLYIKKRCWLTKCLIEKEEAECSFDKSCNKNEKF